MIIIDMHLQSLNQKQNYFKQMNLDNPESLIYKPNYKKPEEQQKQKKEKLKETIKKSIIPAIPADRQQIENSLLPKLQQILDKNPQARQTQQNVFINKYIEGDISPFFTALAECTNLDIAKMLMKTAHIHDINKNRMLVKSGQSITRLIIILQGKFGKVSEPKQKPPTKQLTNSQLLHGIIDKSTILLRQVKRKWKTTFDDPRTQSEFKTTKANLFELEIQKYYGQQQVFNMYAVDEYRYSETLVSCTAGKIMSISYKGFLEVLANYVKAKKTQKLSLFRKFEYFNSIENDKLLELIDYLPIIIKKKGQAIYLQGDSCQSIFILLRGSIKLNKMVELFKENPNLLYKNRESIPGVQMVNHADFSEVYNYKPRSKLIQLGIVSDVCIFGEEQIVCNKKMREVNAYVADQEVHYYEISLRNIEGLTNERKSFLEEFKSLIYDRQTQKKILYRQEKLGEVLLLQNQNNMDYFYLEEEKPTTAPQTHNNKFKITRMNNFISSGPSSPNKQKIGRKAHYNIFNFTKLQRPKIAKINTSLNNITKEEQKIINLIHTVDINKQKNQGKSKMRNKRQSFQHTIDIHNPLFSRSYLDKIHRENVKISKQSRMRPISANKTANRSFAGRLTAR